MAQFAEIVEPDAVVRFPRVRGHVSWGSAESICFGCGDDAESTVTAVFHRNPLPLPIPVIGRVASMFTRERFEIPTCARCRLVQGKCRRRGLLWFGATILAAGVVPMVAMLAGLDLWLLIVIWLGGSFYPIRQWKYWWTRKDEGGGFIWLLIAVEREVRFELVHASVARRLREAIESDESL